MPFLVLILFLGSANICFHGGIFQIICKKEYSYIMFMINIVLMICKVLFSSLLEDLRP